MKIYYTPIQLKSLSKNTWRFGGHATTTMSNGRMKIEVNQYGKTPEIANQKVIDFLKRGGSEIECVETLD